MLRDLPELTLRQLLKLAGGLKSDISLLLDEYVLGKSSSRDVIPEGLEIFQGLVLRKKEKFDEIEHPTEGIYPSTTEEKEAMFQKAFKDYEKREGQVQMLDHVYSAFQEERHAISIGKEITARTLNGSISGKALGITDEGVLKVEDDLGEIHHIYSADIELH